MSYVLDVNSNDSILIHLDSQDADLFLSTDDDGNKLTTYYQYVLREKVICPSNQVMLISLYNASVPYTFYNINATNNIIDIRLYCGGGSCDVSTSITIPFGNYTALSFQSKVISLMGELNDDDIWGGNDFTFDMDYDDDLQKFNYTFTHTNPDDPASPGSMTFQFDKLTHKHQAYIQMGFNEVDIVLDSGVKHLSTNCIDMNASIHGIYVRTNLTSNSMIDSQNGNLSNILGRIPIEVQAGGVIFLNPSNSTHKSIITPTEFSTITIRLTDERNKLLNLNGLHFQVGIKVDFMMNVPRVMPMTKEDRRLLRGQTRDGVDEQAVDEMFYKQSKIARANILRHSDSQKIIDLITSGRGKITRKGDTMTIKKTKN